MENVCFQITLIHLPQQGHVESIRCVTAASCDFPLPPQLPSHPLTPSRHAEGRAMTVAPTYHTLPHPSSHGTSHSTMMWGPLEPPNTPKPWSLSCLRPAPPLRPSAALCYKEVSDALCIAFRHLRLRVFCADFLILISSLFAPGS